MKTHKGENIPEPPNVDEFNQLMKLDPEYFKALMDKGVVELLEQLDEGVIELLEQLCKMKLDPESLKALVNKVDEQGRMAI